MPYVSRSDKGRGSNPTARSDVLDDAQQRPGVEPRRHQPKLLGVHIDDVPRSTKAGGRTPATLGDENGEIEGLTKRSTKAGGRYHGDRSRCPGPSRHSPRVVALNKGRGSNPGDTTVLFMSLSLVRRPLNKGRGSNPGDTAAETGTLVPTVIRSTKAGGRTPATPALQQEQAPAGPRSTKAGGRTPATHARCVKACAARL